MSKFRAGCTVFKVGNTPVNLLPDVGYAVRYVLGDAVTLEGYEGTVNAFQLESVADRAKRREKSKVAKPAENV